MPEGIARQSPDIHSPCGLWMPGEELGLWPSAACKVCNDARAAKTRFYVLHSVEHCTRMRTFAGVVTEWPKVLPC